MITLSMFVETVDGSDGFGTTFSLCIGQHFDGPVMTAMEFTAALHEGIGYTMGFAVADRIKIDYLQVMFYQGAEAISFPIGSRPVVNYDDPRLKAVSVKKFVPHTYPDFRELAKDMLIAFEKLPEEQRV